MSAPSSQWVLLLVRPSVTIDQSGEPDCHGAAATWGNRVAVLLRIGAVWHCDGP